MHYGLLTLDLHGHQNPMTTLGGELARRGHRVTLFGSSRAKPFADRAEIDWVPLNDSPELQAGWDKVGELSGMAAVKLTGELVHQNATATQAALPALLASHQIDLLLVDQFAPAGVRVAEDLQLPYIVVCNAMAVHLHDSVPPAPMNWPYREGPWARLQNRGANWILRTLFSRIGGSDEKEAISPMLLTDPERSWGLAMIAQQPAFFDYPDHPRPANFHYTAPWHATGRDRAIPFPWDQLDGRPLIYASMGTLQNKMRPVYEAIAQAAEGMDVQVVLSLGSPDASLEIQPPENVIVVPFAPQLQLLERSTAVITHAGMNTALETLARGLPMLCLPVTNDQPGVARRVEHLGAGRVLNPARATPARIRRELTTLLQYDRYRQQAVSLSEQMNRLNGLHRAADLIEEASGASREANRRLEPTGDPAHCDN